jgi:hypothetical protein
MIAFGDELHPKTPKPSGQVRRPLTEERLEAHVAQTGLSHRDALTELSQQGYVLDTLDEEAYSPAEMSEEEEERAMLGVTNREIEAHAQQNKLSYRAAMIELSARTKEER